MTIEKKLKYFDFWGGAATNAAKLTPEELDQMETLLEGYSADTEPWSTTEVNDEFWFNFEDMCESIGLDYEEVMARK
jgi:hypothetical protein